MNVHELSAPPRFAELLSRLRDRPGLAALDSAAGWPRRWSWIAFEPRRELALERFELCDLRGLIGESHRARPEDVPGPFSGGFLGAVAYDVGVAGESLRLPGDPWSGPRCAGGIYDDFFVFDHERDVAWLVLGDGASPARRGELLELARAASSVGGELPGEASGGRDGEFVVAGELKRLVPSDVHVERVERARKHIAAGEIYQANVAHPFELETRGDPLDLYLRLRRTNPAPYMGYLRFPGGALLSASPELLLEARGRRAHTRPIKGTSPRATDPVRDAELARDLLASEKDRAELTMIVDLERNDLGRVARIGSVRVEGFPTLRSYAGVHHLTADVACDLAPGSDGLDALAALFPGGSVTGAPKLRAMEIIAELEGEGRGFFTGSLGFCDERGNAVFNVLIRTLVWRPELDRGPGRGRVRYHVGGGITWGSDAETEDHETLVKGAKLVETLLGAPAAQVR